MSRPGRRAKSASGADCLRRERRDVRPSASPCRRRRVPESACFRAPVRVARARPSRPRGRSSAGESRPIQPTVPLGPLLRRFQRPRAVGYQPTAAFCGRESNPRHPGYEPGALSAELPRPGPAPVPNPCTEHAQPTVRRRGRRAAGPTRPAAQEETRDPLRMFAQRCSTASESSTASKSRRSRSISVPTQVFF